MPVQTPFIAGIRLPQRELIGRMNPQLTTAPGRIEIYVHGERFASYETDKSIPGFTALYATGLRAISQPAPPTGHGLWIGHGRVNDIAFDGGAGSGGCIKTTDLLVRRGPLTVGFQHECGWIAPGGRVLLNEVRTIRVANGPSAGALLDITLELMSPPGAAVVFGQDETGLLQARIAGPLLPSGGGQMRNSSDEFGPDGIDGRQAAWCACNGVVLGETVGLALLDHPGNPWHPPRWVCRADGVLSPSPFLAGDFQIDPGRALELRYRVVVHSGYVEAGWIRERLADWLRE